MRFFFSQKFHLKKLVVSQEETECFRGAYETGTEFSYNITKHKTTISYPSRFTLAGKSREMKNYYG